MSAGAEGSNWLGMLCPRVLCSSQIAVHVVFVLSMSNFLPVCLPPPPPPPPLFNPLISPTPPNLTAATELSLLHSHLPGFIPRSLSPPMGLINHPHPPPPFCTYIPPPISRTCTPSSCSWGLGVGGQGEAARLIN